MDLSLTKKNSILYRQEYHLLGIVLSIIACYVYTLIFVKTDASILGLGLKTWIWISLMMPILHQLYVWIIWRVQIQNSYITKNFPKIGFQVYKIIFAIFLIGRPIALIALSLASPRTLSIPLILQIILIVIFTGLSGYVLYSIAKYFGFNRAFGLDHFIEDPASLEMVKQGAFKHFNNAMYTIGLTGLYLPGLLLESLPGLILAAFNHIFIWVHYYTVEKPDLEVLYG